MFTACSPHDGFGLASCSSRGLPPASPASDPSTVLTFAHRGHELSLTLRHCARQGAHTGGHVWSGSRHLSRWMYARRHLLSGQRVLELGCGLALPGLLAATLGATVVATDELDALVEHGRRHTAAGVSASRLTMQLLDFTARHDVLRLVDEDWDLVVFADCVFGGRMGALLLHSCSMNAPTHPCTRGCNLACSRVARIVQVSCCLTRCASCCAAGRGDAQWARSPATSVPASRPSGSRRPPPGWCGRSSP